MTVYGGPAEHGNSCGIYANGTITINSGTVNATGESAAGSSYGIDAGGAVTIENGTVNATSGETGGNSVGIHITNSITINGGDVTATAGDAGGNSYGIHTAASSTDITVNGGSVTATSGEAKGDSCGIFVESKELASIYSSAAINGGSVTAKGGDAVGTGWYSCGMKVDGNFTISGGTVTATAGDALEIGGDNYSLGIFSYTDLTISGGEVTGIGGTGGLSSGIACNDTLAITGGTVVGEGGPLAGTNIQYSAGINGIDKVKISGGTVTGTGGDTEAGDSFGICTGDTTAVDPVQLTIQNATVTATGGAAPSGNSSGIFATNTIADVEVTIENAAVTATGGSAGTGNSYGILAETTGTDKSADVTINGNSVVRANMTGAEGGDGETISGTTVNRESGIIFENGVGTVYGTVTLREDLTVGADERLTIPRGATLTIPEGKTLTNSGVITNEGTLTNNGTLTIGQGGALTGNVNGNPVIYAVTVLTDGNGTASASPATAAAGTAITLTASPNSGYHFERWEVVSGGVTIENNAFTMPTQPVTVRAVFARNSSGGSSTYTIATPDAEHGTVAVSPSRASRGDTVTITVRPDEGYELAGLTVTDANGGAVDLTRESATEYTFEMPRGRVTVEASFVESAPEPLPFADVDDGDWFADAVRFVYENGLMNGTGDTTFSPNMTTSRGMIVTVLWRQAGSPVVNYAMDFDDVNPAVWYGEAIRWAASEGIVGGYGNGQFGPDDPITREQLSVILYRYAAYAGYDVTERADLSGFSDAADASSYALDALAWANAAGIVNGTSGTTLDPQGSAVRAQAAAMLQRFCENIAQ